MDHGFPYQQHRHPRILAKSAESRRPITFIALFDRDDIPEAVRTTLKKSAPLIARGARPQTSPLPLTPKARKAPDSA